MRLIHSVAVILCAVLLLSCTPQRHPPVLSPSEPLRMSDLSSPELTLRTFWSAIKAGDTNLALRCTSPDRIRKGRHGRDVSKLIVEYRSVETNAFRFIGGAGSSCSIESPNHCMNYNMEKNDKGEWIIVSIHP